MTVEVVSVALRDHFERRPEGAALKTATPSPRTLGRFARIPSLATLAALRTDARRRLRLRRRIFTVNRTTTHPASLSEFAHVVVHPVPLAPHFPPPRAAGVGRVMDESPGR